MRHHPRGEYPACWPVISEGIKVKHGRRCERCGSPSVPKRILTVHHLDGDKENMEEWNLAALCQVCHLHIQGRVFLPQTYMFEHSEWFRPHLDGYLASRDRRLGVQLLEVAGAGRLPKESDATIRVGDTPDVEGAYILIDDERFRLSPKPASSSSPSSQENSPV